MQTLTTSAGTVAYRIAGDGPSIVLLSSGGHDHHDYDSLQPALAEHHRTIAVDWPGHGASPAPARGGASAMGFADAAEHLVETLAPEGAVIVGNSVGGFAAARLAVRRPELVRGLVLVDSGGFDGAPPLVRLFCALMGNERFLRRMRRPFVRRYMRARTPTDRAVRDAAIAGLADPVTRSTYAGLWRSFSSPEHDLREHATSITAPTLVIWGTRDPVIPLRIGRRIAATIPDARIVELDAGHVPYATEPERCTAELLRFLNALPTDGRATAPQGA